MNLRELKYECADGMQRKQETVQPVAVVNAVATVLTSPTISYSRNILLLVLIGFSA
jgi:hypothetical protein